MVDTPGQMVVLETPGLYQIAKARYLSWKSLERVNVLKKKKHSRITWKMMIFTLSSGDCVTGLNI